MSGCFFQSDPVNDQPAIVLVNIKIEDNNPTTEYSLRLASSSKNSEIEGQDFRLLTTKDKRVSFRADTNKTYTAFVSKTSKSNESDKLYDDVQGAAGEDILAEDTFHPEVGEDTWVIELNDK
ncbi:hypothetical protein [Geomicrobium sp. JCM 19039]|uniref:hypothetical protein n=1 Tax=Geomicrobium sp. JCM 19039 TaxID=1460636 RepID=UPI001267E999|nr:hypothetical protein [Geomicrobium sp. JCM 19039]